MRFFILLTIVLSSAFLGCGGPDTKPLLQSCAAKSTVVIAAISTGDWPSAAAGISAAKNALGEDLEAKAEDGRPLSAHWADQIGKFRIAVKEALPRLATAESRASLTAADTLIDACMDASLKKLWHETGRITAEKRIADAEAVERAASERKQALTFACSYVVLMPVDKDDREARDFRDVVVDVLTNRFAPIPIVAMDKAPSGDKQFAGTITVSNVWGRVNYGGANDLFGQGVPVSMETNIVVCSRRNVVSLEGPHSFSVKKPGPDQVNQQHLRRFARDQSTTLYELMVNKLNTLPALENATAVAERLANEASAPPLPAWRLVTSCKANRGEVGSLIPIVDGYQDVLAALSLEVQKRLNGAPLMTDTTQPAPAGTVTMILTVDEAAYGSSTAVTRTLNGTVPVAMNVIVTIAPTDGAERAVTCRAASVLESIEKASQDQVEVGQRRLLGRQLGAAIAAHPALGVQTK